MEGKVKNTNEFREQRVHVEEREKVDVEEVDNREGACIGDEGGKRGYNMV